MPFQYILPVGEYRSRGERSFAQWLKAKNIPFGYEPETFKLGDDLYLPDFILPEGNIIIEVKPMGKKRKPGRLSFVRENSPAQNSSRHNGSKVIAEKLGASEWDVRCAKEIINHAPEVLSDVTKLGGLYNAAKEAKKRSAAKPKSASSKKKLPTLEEVRKRREAILSH